MESNTPNRQDMSLAMDEIERLGFEPVLVLKCLSRAGHLSNGVAVGFRWIQWNGSPIESWSTWRWAVEDNKARLFSGSYDHKDRDAAIDEARDLARY